MRVEKGCDCGFCKVQGGRRRAAYVAIAVMACAIVLACVVGWLVRR